MTPPPEDLFARYGLPWDAPEPAIVRAHRRALHRWHPDKHPGAQAAERFIQAQEDFAVLRDPVRRVALLIALRTAADPISSEPSPPPVWLVPPSDISQPLRVPLAVAWAGGPLSVRVLRAAPCACRRHPACPRCHGTGQVFASHTVLIVVPPGTFPGSQVRARGAGHVGGAPGNSLSDPWTTASGDLLLTVAWSHRHGWLWCPTGAPAWPQAPCITRVLRVPAALLRRGTSFRVRAPDGRMRLCSVGPTDWGASRWVRAVPPTWHAASVPAVLMLRPMGAWWRPLWALSQGGRALRMWWTARRNAGPPTSHPSA